MVFRSRKPLLHAACERGAWRCTQFLVTERSEEIHILKDEYYPIHYAVLHDSKFLELLINAGADTTVRTCTQQMTLLHVGKYFNIGKLRYSPVRFSICFSILVSQQTVRVTMFLAALTCSLSFINEDNFYDIRVSELYP